MIAGHIDNSGATLGMPHYSADHIGMTLFPSPSVLLYFPCVNDVAYKIQGFAGVVFEKVVECFGLAVASA
jgi:hypothetical protein